MKINKKIYLIALSLLFTVSLFSASYAHYLWLNVDDYTPEVGQEITVTLGWGHKFPETPKPPREELVRKIKFFILDPAGREIPIHSKIENGKLQPIRLKFKKEGIYLIVGVVKNYVTKTTDGYFYKPKNELKDKEIVYSKWSESTAIAIISVGKPLRTHLSLIPESKLFIIPINNPSLLKEGEIFNAKVLFKNRPFRGWVYSTYEGFSNFKDTFAWTTRTNINGVAKLKVLKRKNWLVKVETTEPFSDKSKSDFASYKCTLTFGF